MLVDTGLHPSVAAKPRENFGRAGRGSPGRGSSRARTCPPSFASAASTPGDLPPRRDDPPPLGPRLGDLRVPRTRPSCSPRRSGTRRPPTRGRCCAATGRRTTTTCSTTGRSSFDGPSIASYASFGRTFDLFGDGSVRLAFTPGHSAGHQCVIARLRERDFVIAGDAVYTQRQLEGGARAAAPARPPHLAPLAARSCSSSTASTPRP